MNQPDPTTLRASDNTNEAVAFLGSAFTALATSQAEAARAQTEMARVQSDSNVALARLHADSERFHARQTFVLQIGGGVVLVGVIAAGFLTGHFDIVTHALTGVTGALAGYGIAARARRG